MWLYCLARLASAAVVIAGVVSIVFLFVHLIPGDPVEVMLGESAHMADRQILLHALGLDRPLSEQWLHYVGNLLHFDLGISLYSQRAITEVLLERITATLVLAGGGLMIAILVSLPLGILAALKRGSCWDRAAMGFAVAGVSIPNFWLGPMLVIVFSIELGWFPVSGYASWTSLILPSLTLGTALAAVLSRMIRAAVLDVLSEDYIQTARAKGLHPAGIVLVHIMPNAALPILTVIGLQLGGLLGGAIITETIFSWPGIGRLTVEAILRRDYPVVQACVLLISVSYVIINTMTDLAYGMIDPRIRRRV